MLTKGALKKTRSSGVQLFHNSISLIFTVIEGDHPLFLTNI